MANHFCGADDLVVVVDSQEIDTCGEAGHFNGVEACADALAADEFANHVVDGDVGGGFVQFNGHVAAGRVRIDVHGAVFVFSDAGGFGDFAGQHIVTGG